MNAKPSWHLSNHILMNVEASIHRILQQLDKMYLNFNVIACVVVVMVVTKPYSLQWFYRNRLVTKVYYTCAWLNMINFIVKDYVLRTHTEQWTIESQYFGILEKKHERSV